MITRRSAMIAVALVAYAVFAIAMAPATLMDTGIRSASEGRVRLAEAQGTIWSGSGQLEVRDASGRRGIGRSLSWKFQPASPLHGHLEFDVDFGHANRPFPVALSLFRLETGKASFVLPAAMLAIAMPKLAALDPGGDLFVDVSRLAFEKNAVSGQASVEWPDASSAISPDSPLGSYRIRFADGTGGMIATLATLRGPLFLTGTGAVGKNDATGFRASASIDPRWRSRLEPFLRLVAIERGNGSFELQLNQDASAPRGVAGNANVR